MHKPPPKILFTGRTAGASTTPTGGNLSHDWRNTVHRLALVTKMRRADNMAATDAVGSIAFTRPDLRRRFRIDGA